MVKDNKDKIESFVGDIFTTQYCFKWSGHKKRPFELKTENEARTCHEKREWYTAVLGGENPYCAIELRKDFISVTFFDHEIRPYLVYHFYEIKPDILFLKTAILREYEGQNDKILKATMYEFQESGDVKTSIGDYLKNTDDIINTQVDVKNNYDRWPSFKDYKSIMKKERD